MTGSLSYGYSRSASLGNGMVSRGACALSRWSDVALMCETWALGSGWWTDGCCRWLSL